MRPGRTTDHDTVELAARLRDGDTRALEALYDRVGRRAFALAYWVLGDGTVAEDAVQEGVISFWRQAGRIDPARGNVASLLMTIVYRRAIDVVCAARASRARVAAGDRRGRRGPRGARGRSLRRCDIGGGAWSASDAASRSTPCDRDGVLRWDDAGRSGPGARRAGGTVKSRLRLGLVPAYVPAPTTHVTTTF